MKENYDFSKGRRGRVVAEPPPEPAKVRITIRVDEDLIDYFGAIADWSGGKAGYQTLINSALREYVEGKNPKWEEPLRRIHSRGDEPERRSIAFTVQATLVRRV